MCCPSNKVLKSDTKSFLGIRALHEDNLCEDKFTLQAMTPTNVRTVHQISLLHTESNLDRLGLLSPTHGERSQQQSGQFTLQSLFFINKLKFLKATHHTEITKIEILRSMAMETLSW